jgi:hypothetical protein
MIEFGSHPLDGRKLHQLAEPSSSALLDNASLNVTAKASKF